MNEYMDCEALWPTTTSTPTEPAGCCHGDLTSYKANNKCVGIEDRTSCERKSCNWLITDDEDDCIVTTTTTPTPDTTEEEVGCCKGEDAKSNEMCNNKLDRKSCERSSSCTFIVDGSIEEECRFDEEEEPGCCYGDTAKTNAMCAEKEGREQCERSGKCEFRPDESDDEPADCSLPTTTSEPWLGAQAEAEDYALPYNPYKQQQQQKSRKSNKNSHRQEQEAMMFGADANGVVGQAMQYQVSLSSVLLMLVAAFALYHTYAWMANRSRKNKDYAAVQSPATTQQYYQSA